MPGYPLIGRELLPGSRSRLARTIRAFALSALVGAAAGALSAQVRLHLGLPGHKALLWVTPLVVARLTLGRGGEAIAAAVAAGQIALLAGGNLGGGAPLLPLLIVAGAVLDAACAVVQRCRLLWPATLALLGLAGAAANLLCSARRIGDAWFAHTLSAGIIRVTSSYAFFGLSAGVLGAAIALWIERSRRGRALASSPARKGPPGGDGRGNGRAP